MTLKKYTQQVISIKLEDPKAMPLRVHATDAGADLFSNETIAIYPQEQKLIDTGVSLKIPVGYVGLVFNRSSQGKVLVQIANGTGVIDSDYRASVKVLLRNNGGEPYFIDKYATRIAQLVITPIMLAEFREFNPEVMGLWNDTERGLGGFGSTGG